MRTTAEIPMGLDSKTLNKIIMVEKVETTARTYTLARDEDPKAAVAAMEKLLKLLSTTPGAIDALLQREKRGREKLLKGGV